MNIHTPIIWWSLSTGSDNSLLGLYTLVAQQEQTGQPGQGGSTDRRLLARSYFIFLSYLCLGHLGKRGRCIIVTEEILERHKSGVLFTALPLHFSLISELEFKWRSLEIKVEFLVCKPLSEQEPGTLVKPIAGGQYIMELEGYPL